MRTDWEAQRLMSYRESRFRIGKEFKREMERENETRLKVLELADEQRENILKLVEFVHERMTRLKRKRQSANAEMSATEKATLYR